MVNWGISVEICKGKLSHICLYILFYLKRRAFRPFTNQDEDTLIKLSSPPISPTIGIQKFALIFPTPAVVTSQKRINHSWKQSHQKGLDVVMKEIATFIFLCKFVDTNYKFINMQLLDVLFPRSFGILYKPDPHTQTYLSEHYNLRPKAGE